MARGRPAQTRRQRIDQLLRELARYRSLLEGSIYQIGEISSELFDLATVTEEDDALAGELDEPLCNVQDQAQAMFDELDGAPHDGEALDNALAEYRKAHPLKKAKKKSRRAA